MTLTDIRRELQKRGNPKRYEQIRYYFNNTQLKMYGVRGGVLRDIAKQWSREYKSAEPRTVIAVVDALYRAPSFEEKMVASHILAAHPKILPEITEAQWNRWIREIDNWAVSDYLSTDPFGGWLLAYPARGERFLKKLIANKNIWARRVALVGLVWTVRYDASLRWRNLAFSFVQKTMHERDVIMTKAVSWILRGLIQHHAAAVRAFLKQYGNELPAIARREATNKLTTGRKSGK